MGVRDSFLLAVLSVRLDTRLKGVDLADGVAGLTALGGAAEDAARLRRLLERGGGANLLATVVLFTFRALRHYLLPVAEGLEDLRIATQMVGIVLSTRRALVPQAFRACRDGEEAAAVLLAGRSPADAPGRRCRRRLLRAGPGRRLAGHRRAPPVCGQPAPRAGSLAAVRGVSRPVPAL